MDGESRSKTPLPSLSSLTVRVSRSAEWVETSERIVTVPAASVLFVSVTTKPSPSPASFAVAALPVVPSVRVKTASPSTEEPSL